MHLRLMINRLPLHLNFYYRFTTVRTLSLGVRANDKLLYHLFLQRPQLSEILYRFIHLPSAQHLLSAPPSLPLSLVIQEQACCPGNNANQTPNRPITKERKLKSDLFHLMGFILSSIWTHQAYSSIPLG